MATDSAIIINQFMFKNHIIISARFLIRLMKKIKEVMKLNFVII